MYLRLRDDLFFAVAGETGVFLDLRSARYAVLAADVGRALQQVAGSPTPSPAQLAAVHPLIERGLLVPTIIGPAPLAPPSSAHRALIVDKTPVSWLRLGRAIASRQRATRDLRRQPLGALLRLPPRTPVNRATDAGIVDASGAMPIVAAFALVDRLLGAQDKCLPSSIALWRSCRARGLEAKLIFGVRTAPFAAHCWVQIGDTVANDTLEQVRSFTPIMAV